MDGTKKNILVTGGAGFIGSNLVEALLADERVGLVRVIDNLSTGFVENLEPFQSSVNFEFIEGDITNVDTCHEVCKDIDLISHQAALGSVPRSIEDPLKTNLVNISGTLNIFHAAVQNNIQRVVFAASSSTYGDSQKSPKVEDEIGRPLSPYAVTKLVNELYADVFARIYGLEYIGLRYFNIFGPKQDPRGAYAAVIPLFFDAAIKGKSPTINGDGTNSRDFTFVGNAVNANLLALFLQSKSKPNEQSKKAVNTIYNIACGKSTTLNQLWSTIQEITNSNIKAINGPFREGDIPHSLANIDKSGQLLGYSPDIDVAKGLELTKSYYLHKMSNSLR